MVLHRPDTPGPAGKGFDSGAPAHEVPFVSLSPAPDDSPAPVALGCAPPFVGLGVGGGDPPEGVFAAGVARRRVGTAGSRPCDTLGTGAARAGRARRTRTQMPAMTPPKRAQGTIAPITAIDPSSVASNAFHPVVTPPQNPPGDGAVRGGCASSSS